MELTTGADFYKLLLALIYTCLLSTLFEHILKILLDKERMMSMLKDFGAQVITKIFDFFVESALLT